MCTEGKPLRLFVVRRRILGPSSRVHRAPTTLFVSSSSCLLSLHSSVSLPISLSFLLLPLLLVPLISPLQLFSPSVLTERPLKPHRDRASHVLLTQSVFTSATPLLVYLASSSLLMETDASSSLMKKTPRSQTLFSMTSSFPSCVRDGGSSCARRKVSHAISLLLRSSAS